MDRPMNPETASRNLAKFWPLPWQMFLLWPVTPARVERPEPSSSVERAARTLRDADAYRA